MTRRSRPVTAIVAIAWLAAGAIVVAELSRRVPDLPGRPLDPRAFRTPAVTPALTVAQTFQMTGNGLEAIQLRPTRRGETAGTLVFELHDVTDPGDAQLIRSGTAEAAAVVRDSTYRFAFEPVADSRFRRYRLDIRSGGDSGVALWAARGAGYPDGVLLANDRERWADLLFAATAEGPSAWSAFWNRSSDERTSGAVLAIVLLSAWLALGLLLRAIPDDRPT